MKNWIVVRRALVALLIVESVAGDRRVMAIKRVQVPSVQVNCYDLPMNMPIAESSVRYEEWRTLRNQKLEAPPDEKPSTALNTKELQRRRDVLLEVGDDVAREHAKLVQDINGLSQILFFAPQFDDPRDYEDSVYHEFIVPSTTTTAKPQTMTFRVQIPIQSKPSSIPVILAGGASKNRPVRTQNTKSRHSINLVGSSTTPQLVTKQPYSFVGQATTQRPMRVCMPTLPMVYPTTRRPTLWDRLVSFFPRLIRY